MTVYDSNQGDGLWIVFKFAPDGSHLNTHSYNGSYARKPPARTYNKIGPAKMQWTRYQREGYTARCAEVSIQGGKPRIKWVDQDWVLKPEICNHRSHVPSAKNYWTYETCYRRKNHSGIHWSGSEAKKNPDYDPEVAMKETTDA